MAYCLHNLVAKDTISHSTSLVKIVKKCRSIYSALLYKKDMLKSEQERAILEELVNVSSGFESFDDDYLYVQNAPSAPRESIKNDTNTRWNSTLIMLRSILHNKDAIKSCLSKLDKYKLIITQTELNDIKDLVAILTPFEELTKVFSCSKDKISGPKSFFKVHELYDSIQISLSDCTSHKDDLTKLEENFFKRMVFDENLLVSVLLDPNLKDLVPIRNHLEVLKITPNDLLQKFIKKASS